MRVKVLLVPNINSERSREAVTGLAAWLASSGYEPVLAADDAEACGMPDAGVPRSEIGAPELVVALGGDGTILKAAHLLGEAESPLLGVNLGRLGFMAGAVADDLRDAVTSALAGDGRIERRATLSAEVRMGGRDAGSYRALNEVYVGRGPSGRAVRIGVSVNGTLLDTFTCDGVAVATPTGSTAYALSAGGPVLAPEVSGLVVVPVCAHTLRTRPIVVAASDVVELSLPDPARASACLMVDGDVVPCRQPLETVAVARGGHDVSLVKLGGRDFYEVCRDEFFGG